jgi:hypothetical protein
MARNRCQGPGCERAGEARYKVEGNRTLTLYLCDACLNRLASQVRGLFHRLARPLSRKS